MNNKQRVYTLCHALLSEKVAGEQKLLKELIESTHNETKSSAGDKYETARAMLQIEQDNVRKRLNQLQLQLATLNQLDIHVSTIKIQRGSLVTTATEQFFISVALGRVSIGDKVVFAISDRSPLGEKLVGLQESESCSLNGKTYQIVSIE
ncbi:hypothetical protein EXU57_05835 [Segetibacter sp. 3557_3]|uniref:hypothetical protein n=1 Tax=Segetibacter sp. 3557_3 TaxID=2547429 RepID=UPI0010591EA8|nr:hypothetical protein [Segetibacter sp. 3557_3]TDH27983.1 hypothetical protein EXU57_05835 [Segetibacter sp. 3557_3]